MAHARKVALIQKQIREWNEGNREKKMCTARRGWLSMSFRYPKYKKSCQLISTDRLKDILKIDLEEETVRVEPMVTIGQLMKQLLPLGYTLPIVPELQDLTIGGLVNGSGIESSGRKYGLFQHICLSYDLVMADGSLVTASKGARENQSLFYGVPWSHGTLGFLVAATIMIIPCKPFVRLTYMPCATKKSLVRVLDEEAMNRENEFVEGIQFTPNSGVVITGKFAADPAKNLKVNRVGRWYKPWFFTYVRKIGELGNVVTEYVPVADYYSRHEKSLFWELQDLIPFGNNVLFRYLLGWALPPKISLLKATTVKPIRRLYERRHVLQDFFVPMNHLEEVLEVVDSELDIYPLWLCPFNLPSSAGILKQKNGRSIMYVDVGIYGTCEKPSFNATETIKRLVSFIRSAQGVQMLYADVYMDKSEFWEMFDSSLYGWLRVKYGCRRAFLDVYEKVCNAARE